MIIMDLFDLHCDTLYEMFHKKNKKMCITHKKIKFINNYVGCFAIWIPPEYYGIRSLNFFLKIFEKSVEFLNSFNNKKRAILCVENGSVLAGDIKNIDILKKCNVKILTLTWNGSCEIGDGVRVVNPGGLTKFGENVIKNLEKNNIIVDISHASEKLFYDVCSVTKKSIVATHSNSKKICDNSRNLTDDQFEIIKKSQGIVGINFCNDFLVESGRADIIDIFRHIEHFLSLSGENTVCIGSDFDGANLLDSIHDVSEIYKLYEFMLVKNYNEKLVKKIFFNNAYEFFKKNM
ncbi:MAG: membrane dipeptidase [Candidatus Improbicoccus devescovinae]|nr:MAG: membrane dipeptidase [Candidatus Improbicoccus devescovinae]